ncbi:MAG: type IV pilin N-terminal domain-containing protein [Methanomassiliicoccales archaeon]|nr:type IV pilin N-terminal domain-containing protein [Methanomassiliicoccales archaeon]
MIRRAWAIKRAEAVSPVIATILMVAITVVLAAVLYVAVIGMGGTSATPTAAFVKEKATVGGYDIYYIRLVSISSSTVKQESVTTIMTPEDHIEGGVVHDTSPNGYLGAGDYLVVGNLTAGTTYTIVFRYDPTMSTMATFVFTAS